MAVAGTSALFFLQPAAGHGTATYPPARQYSCWERWGDDFQNPDMADEDPMCWQAWQANPNTMWNWNGLLREGMQGQHEQRIADGTLCSGGNAEGGRYDSLDEVGPWHATPIDNQFTLHYEDAATHGGDYYWVYITHQGFDVTSEPLGWGDLERVVETGVYEPGEPVDIPVNAGSRTGQHVVYVIWQASHLDQTFYSCSDVWFGDGGPPDPDPTDPDPTDPDPTDPDPTEPDPTDPDPTDPGGSGECEADYSVANDWGSGFTANVEVTATGGSGAWEVSWSWPGDQQITNSWSSTISESGSSVTASGASYNATLSSGASTSFGFNAAYTGSNNEPELTCTIG
ncbi:hypothetical protein GCM10029992_30890 [Glycomyces albus]